MWSKFFDGTYSLTLPMGLSCETSYLTNGISNNWAMVDEMAFTGLLGPVLSKVRVLGPLKRTL